MTTDAPVTRTARGEERPETPAGYRALVSEQQQHTASRLEVMG